VRETKTGEVLRSTSHAVARDLRSGILKRLEGHVKIAA
jgi:hypothetical protein